MIYEWNELKNYWLKANRGVGFEEIVEWPVVTEIENPSRRGQYLLLLEHQGYIWAVPFVKKGPGVCRRRTAHPEKHWFANSYSQCQEAKPATGSEWLRAVPDPDHRPG